VWLIENNAILSQDSMVRRGWDGNSSCQFCDTDENINHLFSNGLQVVIRGLIAQCIGATNVPSNVYQYWEWIKTWLPGGGMFHSFGLAAICWAVWKSGNSYQ
jgi:hypothetical protein